MLCVPFTVKWKTVVTMHRESNKIKYLQGFKKYVIDRGKDNCVWCELAGGLSSVIPNKCTFIELIMLEP